MSQSQRKGSSSASGASGKGARPKQKNANATVQIHGAGSAHGRAMPWNCTVCDNVIAEDDDSIECHACKLWYHKLCTDLSEVEYQVLEKGGESLLWICCSCVREGAAANAQACRTDVKLDMLVKLLEDMVQRLDKLERAHTGKSLDAKIEEAVKKELREVMDERDEQARRAPNLIIMNVGESKKKKDEDKKNEDGDKVMDILRKSELTENELTGVKVVARLGREIREGRARPIKIHILNPETRAKVLKNARLINPADCENRKKIYINKDLTQNQREQGKALRDELREKREKENHKKWVIRNDKII